MNGGVDDQDSDVADEASRDLERDDVDDGDAIEKESPRAADDPRYSWFEGNFGDVTIADERNPFAWVSSDDAEDLDDWE